MNEPELRELLAQTMDDMAAPRVAESSNRIRKGEDAIVLPREAIEAMRRAYEMGLAELERCRGPSK